MAYLKSPFGKFSGAIGNIVFRMTNGKGNIVGAAPASYKSPDDEGTMNRRTKFSFVVKFSAALIRLASLSIFWQKVEPVSGKRRLSKVFGTMYPQVEQLSISGVELVENADIGVTNPEVNIQSNNVQVIVSALGANQEIDTTVEKTICMEGVLQLSDPINSTSPKFIFIPVHSNDITLILNDSLTFNAPLSGSKLLQAEKYATKKAALLLVTKDAKGMPVKYSETIYN